MPKLLLLFVGLTVGAVHAAPCLTNVPLAQFMAQGLCMHHHAEVRLHFGTVHFGDGEPASQRERLIAATTVHLDPVQGYSLAFAENAPAFTTLTVHYDGLMLSRYPLLSRYAAVSGVATLVPAPTSRSRSEPYLQGEFQADPFRSVMVWQAAPGTDLVFAGRVGDFTEYREGGLRATLTTNGQARLRVLTFTNWPALLVEDAHPVPEPASWAVVAFGCGVVGIVRHRGGRRLL